MFWKSLDYLALAGSIAADRKCIRTANSDSEVSVSVDNCSTMYNFVLAILYRKHRCGILLSGTILRIYASNFCSIPNVVYLPLTLKCPQLDAWPTSQGIGVPVARFYCTWSQVLSCGLGWCDLLHYNKLWWVVLGQLYLQPTLVWD